MRELVSTNETDYMSSIKSKEKPIQKVLDKMYKQYMESQVQ